MSKTNTTTPALPDGLEMRTAAEIAPLLGISASTLKAHVRSGHITDCRWIGDLLFFLHPIDTMAIIEKAKPTA